jgi:hypothetical protein
MQVEAEEIGHEAVIAGAVDLQVTFEALRGNARLVLEKVDMLLTLEVRANTPQEEGKTCPPAYCIRRSVSSATGKCAKPSREAV